MGTMSKKPYTRYWRVSFVPQIAVLLREPHKHGNRLVNLKGATASGDLSNQHQGQISANAKTKMRNAILWLDASALYKWSYSKQSGKWFRWRLNFIHLTLPAQQGNTDQFIKKILNRFFLYAYRKTGLRSYVWKAEPQKRGEIHFHITSDCYIWKTQLQNIWNGCLRHFGIIASNANPPSTRVHPTHNVKLLTAYLIKYMTKNDTDRRVIHGRLWGCSRNLSQAKTFHITFPEMELPQVNHDLQKQSVRVDTYDWLTVYNLHTTYFENLPECEVLKGYREKIKSIQKGYVASRDLFFNGEGTAIDYKQAVKMQLPEIQKMVYAEQLQIFQS